MQLIVPRTGYSIETCEVSKAGVPIGTIHRWQDGKLYRKVKQDEWALVEDVGAQVERPPVAGVNAVIFDRMMDSLFDYDEAHAAWKTISEAVASVHKELQRIETDFTGRAAGGVRFNREAIAARLDAVYEDFDKTITTSPDKTVQLKGLLVESLVTSMRNHTRFIVYEAVRDRKNEVNDPKRTATQVRSFFGKLNGLNASFVNAWDAEKGTSENVIEHVEWDEKFFLQPPKASTEQPRPTWWDELDVETRAFVEAEREKKEKESESKEQQAKENFQADKLRFRSQLADAMQLPDSHHALMKKNKLRVRMLAMIGAAALRNAAANYGMDRRLNTPLICMGDWGLMGAGAVTYGDLVEVGAPLVHEIGHAMETFVDRTTRPVKDVGVSDYDWREWDAWSHDIAIENLLSASLTRQRDDINTSKTEHGYTNWQMNTTEWFAEAYRYAFRGKLIKRKMMTSLQAEDFDVDKFRSGFAAAVERANESPRLAKSAGRRLHLLVPRTGFALTKANPYTFGAAYSQPSAIGAPVGTIHTWSDGKQYKKVDEGQWEPVEEAQRPQWKAPPEQQRLVTVPPTKPNAQQLAKQKEQKAAQVEAEREAREKLPLHEAYPAGTTIDLGPFGWLHVAGTTGATQRVSVTMGTDTERDLSASEMETIIELSKSLSYRSVVDGVSALAHFRAVAAATSHRHPLSPVAAGNLRLDHAFPGMSDSRRLLLRSTLRSLYLFTGANVATVRDPELYNARLAEITGDKRFYIGLYSTVFQPSKQDYEQAHALFKALADKQPPDEAAGTEWYRGMNLDRYLVKDLEEGVYFKLHDISSFTANDTKAKSFANTGEHAPVVFVLTNPRRGAYINGASQYPDEDEILSGGHVRIVSVDKEDKEPDMEDLYLQFAQDWEPSDSDDQAWQETLDEHKNSAYRGWQEDEAERQRNAFEEGNDGSDEGFEFDDPYGGNADEWADSEDSTFDVDDYDDERDDFMREKETEAFDDWYRDEYERPAGVTTVYVEHIADEDLPYGARVLGG